MPNEDQQSGTASHDRLKQHAAGAGIQIRKHNCVVHRIINPLGRNLSDPMRSASQLHAKQISKMVHRQKGPHGSSPGPDPTQSTLPGHQIEIQMQASRGQTTIRPPECREIFWIFSESPESSLTRIFGNGVSCIEDFRSLGDFGSLD